LIGSDWARAPRWLGRRGLAQVIDGYAGHHNNRGQAPVLLAA